MGLSPQRDKMRHGIFAPTKHLSFAFLARLCGEEPNDFIFCENDLIRVFGGG
jgi:hypothetical protein